MYRTPGLRGGFPIRTNFSVQEHSRRVYSGKLNSAKEYWCELELHCPYCHTCKCVLHNFGLSSLPLLQWVARHDSGASSGQGVFLIDTVNAACFDGQEILIVWPSAIPCQLARGLLNRLVCVQLLALPRHTLRKRKCPSCFVLLKLIVIFLQRIEYLISHSSQMGLICFSP